MRLPGRRKAKQERPLLSCCSVSISISCCSLPAFVGLALTALLIWLGMRAGQEEMIRRQSASATS